jgi:cell wall-associated NlpC family hydrolase
MVVDIKMLNELVAECIGVPYKEHGRDIKTGFDCYGLFLYIVNGLGNPIPDYAYSPDWCKQGYNYFIENYYQYADEIQEKELIPSDVILLQGFEGVAYHIAVYIGEGKFIHCGKLGVTIARLHVWKQKKKIHSYYRLRNI